MPSDVNLGVRSPKGLLPLRFPIAHDHVVILKFNSPFRIITGHKLGASRLRMAPEGLFKACPPAACTIARPDLPARFGTPVDLRSTPIDFSPTRSVFGVRRFISAFQSHVII